MQSAPILPARGGNGLKEPPVGKASRVPRPEPPSRAPGRFGVLYGEAVAGPEDSPQGKQPGEVLPEGDRMQLRTSYSFIAPIYDAGAARATEGARRRSLEALDVPEGGRCLLPGIGTGLDIPLLPAGPVYVGLEANRSMMARCQRRAANTDRALYLVEGDVMALPFRNASFDAVVLHLILAVVARPEQELAETVRVLKPGGQLLIFDKFLRVGQKAPLRRALTPLVGRLATRLDVAVEPLLARYPELQLEADEPELARGWFRRLRLRLKETPDAQSDGAQPGEGQW